jgi:uncharacterized protein YdhG (YjbR/CyaY superfamily)
MNNFSTVDEYIQSFPLETREKLETIRKTIRENVPEGATEIISYQIPTFYLEGNLVHFAAYKNHIGFYPTSSGIRDFEKELSKYKTGKGTAQFPLDEPLPLDLIKNIVKFRVEENLSKAALKKKKKSSSKKSG